MSSAACEPSDPVNMVWIRRDMRLHDHAAIHHALSYDGPIQLLFIFDTNILANFSYRDDRRLSFLAHTLCDMHQKLQKKGGGMLILHGSPQDIFPRLSDALSLSSLTAAEDYEAEAIKRDTHVGNCLSPDCDVRFIKDQVIFGPEEITREGDAYKVYTPYKKLWLQTVTQEHVAPYSTDDKNRYCDIHAVRSACANAGLTVLDADDGAQAMLEAIGYECREDDLWPVGNPHARLSAFLKHKIANYDSGRNMMAEDGTSRLSPYLRFGLLSIRECAAAAMEHKADVWLSELIWREFYVTILYFFPESAQQEWNPKYRDKLDWSDNDTHLKAWEDGKTGYPAVDAAMRQLVQEGWMHNRARMIVASFLTKHLRIDWRKGEAFFARYLMDYDMASNVGGWQWAASTGTDAQPYFRVFNPTLQSEKFDPEGDYIRRYVPELKAVHDKIIHTPWKAPLEISYYEPVVDHKEARQQAIDMFKKAS